MGRLAPPSSIHDVHHGGHQTVVQTTTTPLPLQLYITTIPSLFVVSLAATIAILSTLCASHRHKTITLPEPRPKSASSSSSSSSPSPSSRTQETTEVGVLIINTTLVAPEDEETKASAPSTLPDPLRPLPKPPILVAQEEGMTTTTTLTALKHSTSVIVPNTRKLSAPNLSMRKLPGAFTRIATSRRTEQNKHKGDQLLWKKTILMGEKCRARGDRDDYDDDDEMLHGAATHENKATGTGGSSNSEIRSYSRPRTSSSLPVSQANSFSEAN